MDELVWLTEERRPATIVYLGAYFSVVKYTADGIDYEILVTNDEYEFLEEDDVDNPED